MPFWFGSKPRLRRHAVAGAVIAVAALLFTACQPSTVISTLEAVVAAAEVALPVIGSAAGLSPQTSAAIVHYLRGVDVAIVEASTILAGPGTSAQKSAQIAAAFAQVAAGCNCIPSGMPSTVVNVVNAVAQAVARFLANFVATPNAARSARSVPPKVKVSGKDLAALADIKKRAEQNAANLRGVKP